jgi:hypothetical protein
MLDSLSLQSVISTRWFRRLVLLLILAIYTGFLITGISHHEPWFDEAQAWLLGRDSRPLQLINEHLRYEGSPGLWHFALSFLAKAGLPYASMHVLAALLALTGLIIFLFYAPFPLPIKMLFPFTFFILYQYAIVARSYALLPALLFGLAALHAKRRERPGLYAGILALLANTSLHGLLLAFCFALIEALDFLRQRMQITPQQRKHYILAFSALLLAGLFAAWQLRFPPDHAAVHPRRDYQLFFALSFTARFLSNALTEHAMVSGCVVGISLWHFWRSGVLRLFLLPTLLIGHLIAFVYSSPWHEGILFLLWIFCLWISFNQNERSGTSTHRPLMLAALTLVLLIQVQWGLIAFRNDYQQTYSAARAVAEYLKRREPRPSSIYASGFHSIAILPYFSYNIFSNYEQRYAAAFWDWSLQNKMPVKLEPMVLDGPDTIIHGIKTRFNTEAPILPGYLATKFTGHIFWKDRVFEEDSYIVYEKIPFPLHVSRTSDLVQGVKK